MINSAKIVLRRKNSEFTEESQPDLESNFNEVHSAASFDVDEEDPISSSSFRSLIQSSAQSGIGLIIGRVTTRDKVNFKKKYHHHFYGPNLIKLLFKKLDLNGEQIMRSRYHIEYPLAVKNPLTNEVIVGEVEFYLIECTKIKNVEKRKEESKDLPP